MYNKPSVLVDPQNEAAVKAAEGIKSYTLNEADHFLILGGDGTMIKAIHTYHKKQLPFYGVNYGHLGFLMNQKRKETPEKISYRIPILKAAYTCFDGTCGDTIAVNDVWVERSTPQTAKLSLHIDAICRIPSLYADGLLICTPQGSTAYARSMGGIPLPLTTDVFQVVGSNVAFPSWKSALLSKHQHVLFRSEDQQKKRPIRLLADGLVVAENIHSVTIANNRTVNVHLLFDEEYNLAEKITRSQFPQ